jgi:histidinol-phosphate phosphatase family protein
MLWDIDTSWTLFLDRDGVVNVRLMGDYVKTTSEFELLPGVAGAIAKANHVFYKTVVVTNQQGIGKGIMTERNLFDIHTYCNQLLEKENAYVNAFYFAPALANENSELRKPKTGMAYLAKTDFPEIDFSKSVMVGDSDSDILFGKELGMKTVFISHEGSTNAIADLTCFSLNEFIKLL